MPKDQDALIAVRTDESGTKGSQSKSSSMSSVFPQISSLMFLQVRDSMSLMLVLCPIKNVCFGLSDELMTVRGRSKDKFSLQEWCCESASQQIACHSSTQIHASSKQQTQASLTAAPSASASLVTLKSLPKTFSLKPGSLNAHLVDRE